jgi:hypothetical protein
MTAKILLSLLGALTVPLAASAPTALSIASLQPTAIVSHNVDMGNTCSPAVCNISEQNGVGITSILLTFTYPPVVFGKTCYLDFPLGPSAKVLGSQQADVFRTWALVNSCPSYSNNRDIQLGRMNLIAGGDSSWAWTSNPYLTKPTPCPSPGTVESIEFAPVSGATGYDLIVWVQGQESGPRVYYY